MEFVGRLELVEKSFVLKEGMMEIPCFQETHKKMRCSRCNECVDKETSCLPDGKLYCPYCIEMGRVDEGKKFVHQTSFDYPEIEQGMTWEGQLTVHQQRISDEMVKKMKEGQNYLVHAVTGAGKTEMIFPAIDFALSQGKRIGIAVPRVDVCLELAPRIAEAFEGVEISLLHGRSTESFRTTPIVLCTTHQLLRFFEYFDYLILDEVDAFPFVNNAQLEFAVETSLRKNGVLIYLTATPTKKIEEKVKSGEFSKSLLPSRFHGKPLVVPKFVFCEKWQENLLNETLAKELKHIIAEFIASGFPFLIFCPMIHLLPYFEKALQNSFPALKFETVSSVDKLRLEKVMKMREKKVDCLVTTTILERGVTFADVSVVIVGSNHKIYTTSSLVQISGRVGRKLSRPTGELIYLHSGVTKSMKEAKKQILNMNKEGELL